MTHGQNVEILQLLAAAVHRVHALQLSLRRELAAVAGQVVHGGLGRSRRAVVDEAAVHSGVETLDQLVLLKNIYILKHTHTDKTIKFIFRIRKIERVHKMCALLPESDANKLALASSPLP